MRKPVYAICKHQGRKSEQASFRLTWSQTLKDRFSCDVAQLVLTGLPLIPFSYESMKSLCEKYNRAIDSLLQLVSRIIMADCMVQYLMD